MEDGVLTTLKKKYFLRDNSGELIETLPEDMFRRVARALVANEKDNWAVWEYKFFELMSNMRWLPNSPTLMNAGTPVQNMSACFLLDIEDTRESIAHTLGEAMEIFAAGGGVGFPFSKLRAKGDLVNSTKGEASGPVSFMTMYDAMIGTIAQGGKRRGAAIATLRIDHPDILEFIFSKKDKSKLNNFNISVLVTDEFMKLLKLDLEDGECAGHEAFWARDPKTGGKRNFNLEPLRKQHTTVLDIANGPISAMLLWNLIMESAWETGEPGVVFIDTMQNAHPFPNSIQSMKILGTNPCGEAVLRDGEACVLGSLNLMAYAMPNAEDLAQTAESDKTLLEDCVDLRLLAEDIVTAVRALDNIVDLSNPPIDKVKEAAQETRKIGLGTMGLHDLLLYVGLPYSISKSPATKVFVDRLYGFIRKTAERASTELAKERGSFPAYKQSLFIAPRRNASLMSIAPTGTLARIANVSFGIEPVMHFSTHHELVDVQYNTEHPLAKRKKGPGGLPLPFWFEEAHEISVDDHLQMQALVQKHVDQSVSKTINVPADATIQDVSRVFLTAWELGLKGVTLYRSGSRENQPLQSSAPIELPSSTTIVPTEKTESTSSTHEPEENLRSERLRPSRVTGPCYKVKTNDGPLYVDIHFNNEEEICEMMLQLGDGFTDTEKGLANWCARIISKALQYGMPYDEIVKQGASTEFETKSRAYPGRVFWFQTNGKPRAYRSIPEVVSDILIQEVNRVAFDGEDEPQPEQSEQRCESCGGQLMYVEGCLSCECGYSKCF